MTCDTALILAAGKGSRLKPLTDTIPKPLILVGKLRLIEYHIINLIKAGIKTIYINRAHLRHQFDQLLNIKDFTQAKIIFLDEPDEALETAGAIINAFDQSKSNTILAVNADIWCDYDFTNILEQLNNTNNQAHVVLVSNPDHHPTGDFSIKRSRLQVKSADESSYTFSGIGLYSRKLFENDDISFQKLAPILFQQIEEKMISASIHDGDWMDIGTLDRLNLLKSKLEQKSENC